MSEETTETTEQPEESPNAEAKRYRLRLREAETALEAANEQLAGYQRRELDRLAAEHLSEPGDLLALTQKNLGDFLAEDGTVNADTVNVEVTALIDSRPGLRKPDRAVNEMQGRGIGDPPRTASWQDLFRED